jgi:hypothetical protein
MEIEAAVIYREFVQRQTCSHRLTEAFVQIEYQKYEPRPECASFVTVRAIAIFIDQLIEYTHIRNVIINYFLPANSHTQIQHPLVKDAIKFQSKRITQAN